MGWKLQTESVSTVVVWVLNIHIIQLTIQILMWFFSLFITVRVFKQLIKNYNFLISEVVFWYCSLLAHVYIFQPRQSLFILQEMHVICHLKKFVPKTFLKFWYCCAEKYFQFFIWLFKKLFPIAEVLLLYKEFNLF